LSFYEVLFVLGTVKSHVEDHFVLNVASVSIEFAPDCSCIVLYYFKVLIYFIHDSITLTSSEYNISSDGAVIGYVKCAHFIHDSITLTSSEFDVSSDGSQS
ncbi:hypothetical protein T06_7314, partial [Trichinella sp. T6]